MKFDGTHVVQNTVESVIIIHLSEYYHSLKLSKINKLFICTTTIHYG